MPPPPANPDPLSLVPSTLQSKLHARVVETRFPAARPARLTRNRFILGVESCLTRRFELETNIPATFFVVVSASASASASGGGSGVYDTDGRGECGE